MYAGWAVMECSGGGGDFCQLFGQRRLISSLPAIKWNISIHSRPSSWPARDSVDVDSLMVRCVGVSQGLLRQKQFRFTWPFSTFTFTNNTISTLSVWQALRWLVGLWNRRTEGNYYLFDRQHFWSWSISISIYSLLILCCLFFNIF